MVLGLTSPLGWLPALWARKRPAPSRFRMASPIIDRAELPVQRNSTLKADSGMDALSCLGLHAARVCNNGGADFRTPGAAIFHQKADQRAQGVIVCTVDDRARLSPRLDQPGPLQFLKVERH